MPLLPYHQYFLSVSELVLDPEVMEKCDALTYQCFHNNIPVAQCARLADIQFAIKVSSAMENERRAGIQHEDLDYAKLHDVLMNAAISFPILFNQ